MEPFLRHGDHVLTFNWASSEVGDVVVFFLPYSSHPESSLTRRRILRIFTKLALETLHSVQSDSRRVQNDRIFFIKRIDKFVDNYVYVSGDNKSQGAKMKPVKLSQIVGKVILKY